MARWAEVNGDDDEAATEDMSQLIAEARAALVKMVEEE